MFRVWDLNANGLNPSVSIFTGCEHFCSSATNGGDVIATPDGNSQVITTDFYHSHAFNHLIALNHENMPILDITVGYQRCEISPGYDPEA